MQSDGLSPKVPVQAVVTLLVGVLAYFGIDLSVEVSGALAVVLGFAAGYIAPPAPTKPAAARRRKRARHEAGTSVVEALLVVFLAVIILIVLTRLL